MIRVDWVPGDDFITVSLRYYPEANRRIARMPATRLISAERGRVWLMPAELYPDLLNMFPGEVIGPPVWKVLGQDPPPPPPWWQEIEPYLNRPIPGLKLPLYDYQLQGANFAILRLKEHGFASIWDEMGLGKTCQAIAAIVGLKNSGYITGPVLYVALASLRRQTVEEGFQKFSDLVAVAVEGDPERRRQLYARARDFDALVIGYETVLQDEEELAKIPFQLVVFDEVHKLKNRSGKMYKAYHRLIRKWNAPVLTLTGTPVQNRAEEVYAIFSLHPFGEKLLGKVTEFNKTYLRMQFNGKYTEIVGYQNLHQLAEKIAPFYIRRTREDANIPLPEVQQLQVWVDPTDEQRQLFTELWNLHDQVQDEIRNCQDPRKRQQLEKRLQGVLLMLQGAADDPALFARSRSEHIRNKYGGYGKQLSGKRQMFREIIEEQTQNGKVLVFSQFRTMVEILAEDLKQMGIGHVVYTGEESDRQRSEVIEQIRYNPNVRVMLATDAASTGLNLQVCRTLIHFDPPWNPTVQDQRNGRIVRSGSNHNRVLIISLLCRDSIDERIVESQQNKRALAGALLQ